MTAAERAPDAAAGGAGASGPVPEADLSLVHRVAPLYKLLRVYSRLEVAGLERIPDGPALLVANHTGWIGLDYAYVVGAVWDARGRFPRGVAHPGWFSRPEVARFAQRLGLVEVSKENLKRLLGAGELVLIFPEGEAGAFKPEKKRYEVQEFARGFVRVAFETGSPIVPVAIVGGEEANPSAATWKGYEDLLELKLPVPKNLFPRPVRWRIEFLPPIPVEKRPEHAADRQRVHSFTQEVHRLLQDALAKAVERRGHPYR